MITLRVTTEGSEEEYTDKALPRDVLKWEMAGHKRAISDFRETQRYADIYEIGWHLAKRKGWVDRNLPLAEFMNNWDVEMIEEDTEGEKIAAGWDFARRHGLIDPSVSVRDFIRDYPEIPEDQLGDPEEDPKATNPAP